VLVIDMLNTYRHPDADRLASNTADIIESLTGLIARARSAGAAVGTDPPSRYFEVANGCGSVWPGIAAAATAVLVVSEADARRMSGCNPDVEKTAQRGFADRGHPSVHLGFLRRPRLTACCPIPGM
jgi:hypothetical protein